MSNPKLRLSWWHRGQSLVVFPNLGHSALKFLVLGAFDGLGVVMNISHAVPSSVASISFSFLSSADIKRISVKQIVNPVIFDHLNNPNPGGLYDACLGPSSSQDLYVHKKMLYHPEPID